MHPIFLNTYSVVETSNEHFDLTDILLLSSIWILEYLYMERKHTSNVIQSAFRMLVSYRNLELYSITINLSNLTMHVIIFHEDGYKKRTTWCVTTKWSCNRRIASKAICIMKE